MSVAPTEEPQPSQPITHPETNAAKEAYTRTPGEVRGLKLEADYHEGGADGPFRHRLVAATWDVIYDILEDNAASPAKKAWALSAFDDPSGVGLRFQRYAVTAAHKTGKLLEVSDDDLIAIVRNAVNKLVV